MAKPKKTVTDDWRIHKKSQSKKNARPTHVSWRARIRRILLWLKRLSFLAIIAGLVYGCYYIYQNIYFQDLLVSNKQTNIKEIKFETNGSISSEWIRDYLQIPYGSKLSDVNIFEVKQTIDSLTQIKDSKVERVYPDILKITIAEYAPMAKIAIKVDLENRTYLMDKTGTFFYPVCISNSTIEDLLYIEGMDIKFSKSMPRKYTYAQTLSEFIDVVNLRMPNEFKNWYSLDVSQIDSLTLPIIKVRTKNDAIYIFETKNYIKQLDRLEYILKYLQDNPYNRIEKIDLTLKDWSILKVNNKIPN